MPEEPEHYGGIIAPEPVERNPGDLLTLFLIAALLTADGGDKLKVREQLRYFAKLGYIHPVAYETQGRKALLFQPDTTLLAAVLIRIAEFGVSSSLDVCQAVSLAFTAWTAADLDGNEGIESSPGLHVMREHRMGLHDWTLEVWSFADLGGTIRFAARLYARQRGEGTDWHFDVSKLRKRAVFAVDLSDILDRLDAATVAGTAH